MNQPETSIDDIKTSNEGFEEQSDRDCDRGATTMENTGDPCPGKTLEMGVKGFGLSKVAYHLVKLVQRQIPFAGCKSVVITSHRTGGTVRKEPRTLQRQTLKENEIDTI